MNFVMTSPVYIRSAFERTSNPSSNDEALRAFLRFDRELPALKKLLSDMELDAGTHKIDCATCESSSDSISQDPSSNMLVPLQNADGVLSCKLIFTVAGSPVSTAHDLAIVQYSVQCSSAMRSATHPCRSLSNCGQEDEAERGIMLQDTRTNSPSRQVEMAEHEAAGPSETVKLTVVNLSDEETSASSSDSEDQTFVEKAQSTSKSSVENLPVPAQSSPTKVLFLDGIRGVAAMMVVVQHSHEFEPNLHLGSVAVDAFFILSSFLLTWLFMKKSMKLLAQGAGARAWMFALHCRPVRYVQSAYLRLGPSLSCILDAAPGDQLLLRDSSVRLGYAPKASILVDGGGSFARMDHLRGFYRPSNKPSTSQAPPSNIPVGFTGSCSICKAGPVDQNDRIPVSPVAYSTRSHCAILPRSDVFQREFSCAAFRLGI
ncbi:unnamed protein product [Phytophthora lilii]|uniref:Unnamed protein product n=1 Tax=Phytophthora lilii TaxID=2077276 RepID=A0A9W6TU45_9STRA|nr:unnamed protein product [Phytophthora lilii]